MSDLGDGIVHVRDAVCAILRVHLARPEKTTPKRVRPAQFNLTFVGTGFGIVDDKYVVTAHHVFNDRKPRQPADRFYAFIVPANGPKAFHFPVIRFPIEDPTLDVAVLELGPCAEPGYHLRSVPLTSRAVDDGEQVLTYGFPSPIIARAQVDAAGNFLTGEFFLKSHANEGIVAGQFDVDDGRMYEFNVGWYPGESGGPVCTRDPLAALAVMQSYRRIQAMDGIVPGPHAARPLAALADRLAALGARFV